VAAELHLAEYTLALHLLLQRLEGLIDVVVAYEDLHERFSRMQRFMALAASWPEGRVARLGAPGRSDLNCFQVVVAELHTDLVLTESKIALESNYLPCLGSDRWSAFGIFCLSHTCYSASSVCIDCRSVSSSAVLSRP